MTTQTLPFQTLITIDRNASIPVFQQIVSGMIRVITDGLLQPGFKIPASRELADRLNVHRTTVVAAYEELKIQDWIVSVPRKGIFISTELPLLKPRAFKKTADKSIHVEEQNDFFLKVTPLPETEEQPVNYRMVISDGFPDARIAPLNSLLAQYRKYLKKPYMNGLFMQGKPSGSASLRTELASFLAKTRGLSIDADHMMLTRGAQMAIFIAARMVIKPGSTVIVAEPNYHFANKVFEHLGAQLIQVNADANGIDVDTVAQICKTQKPDLLYIIPHHHHPTTVTLSSERRIKLLEIIRNYKIPVIEDDYDYDFHYGNSPILPLASADHHGFVLYIGSITKTLAPSVRSGYLVAGKEFIRQASALKQMMEMRGDLLMEEAIASLYRNGEMQKHISKSIKLYKSRRNTFCDLLKNELTDMVTFSKPAGGMSVWVTFDEKYPLAIVSAKLAKAGIFLSNGSPYNTAAVNYNGVRIGFAALNTAEMEDFISTLKRIKLSFHV
ncbi:PLP-dependent aminotransferase family protein [Pedobacter sp. AW31-3R]|uniref:aminotransferase-like domain-containing protein n=1 Tax=Pedobacter sp. AW31-3R TaxID=3445781 RepID=UPI003FA13BEE